MGLGNICIKLRTKHAMYQILYTKGYLCQQAWKWELVAYQCVFYRQEHDANVGPHGTDRGVFV